MRGPRPGRGYATPATAAQYGVGRALVRFNDGKRERQFRDQQLPSQMRAARVNVIVIVAMLLAQWPLVSFFGSEPMARSNTVVLMAAALVGVALAFALSARRQYAAAMATLATVVMVMPLLLGAVIIFGAPIHAQGQIIVLGGVIVTYYSSRLDFLSTTASAVYFSLVTIPAWLYYGVDGGRADVVYTVAATALVHVAGAFESRRTHRELRVLSAQREDLREMSTVDVLTSLANRRAFDQHIEAIWATWQTSGATPTVLMLDIDHFKQLNDTLGHASGDVALRMVAECIRGSLRKGSGHIVARYGGEEFVILLPREEHKVAHAVAERIGSTVRSAGIESAVLPRDVHRRVPAGPLTISIGIASARVSMTQPQDLIKAADRALYRAKADGRDCVRCADEPSPAQNPLSSEARAAQ